ncbi:hypothetical protein T265_11807 [Opisthorchis viverrini]|uniref:Uncharacterized protein n=1 Tax=Opisthorchis viverrini TaxID=6198 RepID=A0A074ZW41_OPIVI|nr:hypothetical protein T265_11807 [Opisthorchis viverrini]KER19414.1 hypothetical protein T265_11807 [Opisthorchis viverrini]
MPDTRQGTQQQLPIRKLTVNRETRRNNSSPYRRGKDLKQRLGWSDVFHMIARSLTAVRCGLLIGFRGIDAMSTGEKHDG